MSHPAKIIPEPNTGSRSRLARREIPTLPHIGRGMRNMPAWAISLVFHFFVLAAVGALWVSTPKGTGAEGDRPVGVAIVYEAASGEEYYLSGTGDSTAEGEAGADSISDALPSTMSSGASNEFLNDLLPGNTSTGGDPSSAAGSLGLGDGGGKLGGNRSVPKVKTSVFGIEGEGTRFLYVFDKSDSMNGYQGRPLRSAKSELLTSLESLGPAHQFQIVFYNDTPLPFGGLSGRGPQLLKGDETSKRRAQAFVKDVVAIGGTQHIDALRMALTMGPDVVFFLTDADRPAPARRDLDDLEIRASRAGATIHTIQFGAGPNQTGGGWIRALAEQTLGQYRYVDVTEL